MLLVLSRAAGPVSTELEMVSARSGLLLLAMSYDLRALLLNLQWCFSKGCFIKGDAWTFFESPNKNAIHGINVHMVIPYMHAVIFEWHCICCVLTCMFGTPGEAWVYMDAPPTYKGQVRIYCYYSLFAYARVVKCPSVHHCIPCPQQSTNFTFCTTFPSYYMIISDTHVRSKWWTGLVSSSVCLQSSCIAAAVQGWGSFRCWMR